MTTRTILLLLLFVILAWGGSAGIAYGVVQLTGGGPQGEQGPEGPTGEPGPPGEVNEEELRAALTVAYNGGYEDGACQAVQEAFDEVDSYVFLYARYDPVAQEIFTRVEDVYVNYC